MIAIIDYGVGNLFSLSASLKYIGADAVITKDIKELEAADRIILPGVGAFGDAADKLFASGLVDTIKEQASAGKPLLGICVGMQLLFDRSYEYGVHEGLGLVPGEVDRIPTELKLPQIGWNALHFEKEDPLFKYTKEGDYVYFVHRYAARDCEKSTLATTEYGTTVTAAVREGSVVGTQLHPEKSGEVGLAILKAFTEL